MVSSFFFFFPFFFLCGYKPVSIADPAALGFIISPWSLLLLPSGSVSFTDENISNQDLRAFTAPEVLQNQSLTSLSDVEKVTLKCFLLDFVFYFSRGRESKRCWATLPQPSEKKPLNFK